MPLINPVVKYFSSVSFLLTLLLLAAPAALSQSTNEADPTTIETFPIEGNLPSGTYYYQFRTNAGPATAVLDVTTPAGGASVSASFSGPDCCTADAYVSAESGRADRIRQASEPFTVPSRQKLNITVNISVAKGQTVRFRLNFSNPEAGSGIVVTPPRPTPTPTPTPTPGSGVIITPPNCADLAVRFFNVTGQTGLRKTISGTVINRSRTNRYLGGARAQWIEVLDITDEATDARLVRLVGFVRFTQIAPLGTFRYSVVHRVRENRRTRYRIRIVYAPSNATNRLLTDDDCNDANNTTIRELVEGLQIDDYIP